jgi:hypothetical protein
VFARGIVAALSLHRKTSILRFSTESEHTAATQEHNKIRLNELNPGLNNTDEGKLVFE